MTLTELVALAAATLAKVPHHPAVTPELCAAICWIESSGDPEARGDLIKGHDCRFSDEYEAHGLAQFHWDTWKRFKDQCLGHGRMVDGRDCPDCSMRALIRECNYAMRKSPKISRNDLNELRACACNLHSRGVIDGKRTSYFLRVNRVMLELKSQPSSLKPSPRKRGAKK